MPGWSNADNKFGLTPFIVGQVLGDGCNYSTVQSAIDDCFAAGGGVVGIRASTAPYVENLTLRAGVDLYGFCVDGRLPSFIGAVVIEGNHTFTQAGGFGATLSQYITYSATAGDAFTMNSTGGGAAILAMKFCGVEAQTVAGQRIVLMNPDAACICQFSTDNTNIQSDFHCFENIGLGSGSVFLSLGNSNSSTGSVMHNSGGGSVSISGQWTPVNANLSVMDSVIGSGGADFKHSEINTSGEAFLLGAGGGSVYVTHCLISSGAVSGNWVDGPAGIPVTFGDILLQGSAQNIGAALTQAKVNWQPYAETAAGAVGSNRGTSSFDSASFSVTDGWVQFTGSTGITTLDANDTSSTTGTTILLNGIAGIETGNAGAGTIDISDKRFISEFIVDPSVTFGTRGEYSTIQAAINAISTTGVIYVRTGTYTESLTIPAGIAVQIIGVQSSQENSIVTLIGDITHSGAGTSLALENLSIGFAAATTYTQTTGSATAKNCIFFSTAGSAAVITGGSTIFLATDCQFQTLGISDLVQITDSTFCILDQCSFLSSSSNISTQGAAVLAINFCKFDSSITAGDTSTVTVQYSRTDHLTNPAYNIGATALMHAYHNVVNSTHVSTFFVTGSGEFRWADIVLLSDTGIDPALTNRPQNWQPYGTTGTLASAIRGTAGFSSAFTVTDGFVEIAGGGNAVTEIQGDTGTALPTAGVIQIFGGPGVTVDASGSTLTVSSVNFIEASGAFLAGFDTGYYITANATATLTAFASQGEMNVFDVPVAATTLTVQAGALHSIRIGNQVSSAGGTATSTAQGDSLTLRFRTADTTWHATSVIGNWTLA